MKIDEPDTPFARSPLRTDSEDESKSPKVVNTGFRNITFFPGGDIEATIARVNAPDDESLDEMRKSNFRQRRKEHYNEIKMVKELNSRKLSEDALHTTEDESHKK